MKTLEDFIMPTQPELFTMLKKIYRGRVTSRKGEFVLVKGEVPVMLIAHLDTVHEHRVKQICTSGNGDILMSPQGIGGDDRCGVYAINTIYARVEKKPWLLFTCDEEIGCVGAEKFAREYDLGRLPNGLDDLKCLIEIDRKGKDDAVYYDCDNPEFEDYITSKGFKTQWGSCSDISVIGPTLGVASVNLSSGYYNQHTLHEYISKKQLAATIKKVIGIVDEIAANPDFPKYEHMEKIYASRFGSRWIYDDDYDWGFGAHKVPDGVPEAYKGMYEELIDFYTVSEIEDGRAEFGDEYIELLYNTEMMGDPEAEVKLFGLYDKSDKKKAQ